MALREIQSDRKPRKRLDNSLYSGWSYARRYECPTISLDTDIATLTLGRVLPVAEGGVATSTVADPRLAAFSIDEKSDGLKTYINATYVQIDVSGTAGTYNETTHSRRATTHDDGESMTIIAIATTLTDASIPVRGYTEAAALPAAATDWCCTSVQKTPAWEAGRVLIVAEFIKTRLEASN